MLSIMLFFKQTSLFEINVVHEWLRGAWFWSGIL